jgi:hypothetical protein
MVNVMSLIDRFVFIFIGVFVLGFVLDLIHYLVHRGGWKYMGW